MKHNLKVTIFLTLLFLASHLIGLAITNEYLTKDLPLNMEKPEMEENTSFIPIFIIIIFASIIIFLLAKFKAQRIWKTWFFLTIILTLTISFSAFIPQIIAIALALFLAYIKVFKPNVVVHNFTELFIYGALAALFVNVLNIWSIIALLILISLYDMYAVWKSKHMVKLAKFQTKSKVFAGLLVPYIPKATKKVKGKKYKKVEIQTGILGGGDIGFTLLFSAVILKTFGMPLAILSSVIITLSLLGLFLFSKQNKFYPAMPFLSAGCFIALALIYAII